LILDETNGVAGICAGVLRDGHGATVLYVGPDGLFHTQATRDCQWENPPAGSVLEALTAAAAAVLAKVSLFGQGGAL
jgi:hypothetical protein